MNRPIILDNAIERYKNDKALFNYDYSKDLNTIQAYCKEIPFIELDKCSIELLTETRVDRESDDKDFDITELFSKTAQDRERDDEVSSLIELVSKTFAERERDDEDSINFN